MSVFTPAEIAYLNSQTLGRFATVSATGRPSVRPVGAFYDPQTDAIVIGGVTGSNMAGSKKFIDARDRPDVSFLVDDVATVDPWSPRLLEIRGRAETYLSGGSEVGVRVAAPFPFEPAWILIRPRRILSGNIETGSPDVSARDAA